MLALVVAVLGLGRTTEAAKRPPAPVPPWLEIEVLDPGVEPEGNPAVRLERRTDGQLDVEIPPTILVHRYYYSGDRSFQAQILPGGPCIVVCNHPRNGERVYVPVQMMPGAPRVTYTAHSIEYDYGQNAMEITFRNHLLPKVTYRNGEPLRERVGNFLRLDSMQRGAETVSSQTRSATDRTMNVMKSAGTELRLATKRLSLPVRNTIRFLPFGAMATDPNLEERMIERSASLQRQHEVNHVRQNNERSELTIRTNR